MTDAISRSELIKILREWPDHLGILNNPTCEEYAERYGNLEALAAIAGEVERLPALDVAPVVHAIWERFKYRGGEWWCSNCAGVAYIGVKTPYCPHCGARMDGEADDQL